MTTCKDCGQVIKHCGQGVWIDDTQGDCCYVTDRSHRPAPFDRPATKEAILAQEGSG